MGEALITRRGGGQKEEFREYTMDGTNGLYLIIPEGINNSTFFQRNALYEIEVSSGIGSTQEYYGFGFVVPGLNSNIGTGITLYRIDGVFQFYNNMNQLRLAIGDTDTTFRLTDYNGNEYRWPSAVVRIIKRSV